MTAHKTTAIDTGHRQGAWEYEPTALTGHNFSGWVRQNGHVIAKVLHDRGTQFDGMALVPERDSANGRLLAAAPTMLAALEHSYEWIENMIAALGTSRALDAMPNNFRGRLAIREAIEAARGEAA